MAALEVVEEPGHCFLDFSFCISRRRALFFFFYFNENLVILLLLAILLNFCSFQSLNKWMWTVVFC